MSTCSECVYWRPEEKDEQGKLISNSRCLRYPPQVVALPRATSRLQPNLMRITPVAVHPSTRADETCGEFKSKEEGPPEDGPSVGSWIA